MTEVVNIRFKNSGKVYFFDPNGITLKPGDFAIVETAKGLEYGECMASNHEVSDSMIVPPLRPVIRLATQDDQRLAAENRSKEARAFDVCQQKIEAHKLDMKLVDVEYSFDGSKILFFFTSDGRVDFRELVKDLVSVFRVRIELRQIGVRDGAKMMGGLGICGRPFCCSLFLEEFHPVSIKMAKTQSLSLNPVKISGTCGRLMCCLKYEQEAYEDLVKAAPKISASILTPKGQGIVMEVNLLRQTVKVRVDEGSTMGIHEIPFCDIGRSESVAPVKPEPEPELPGPDFMGRSINTKYRDEATAAADENSASSLQAQNRAKKRRGQGSQGNRPPEGKPMPGGQRPAEPRPGQNGPRPAEQRPGQNGPRPAEPRPGQNGPRPAEPRPGQNGPRPTEPRPGQNGQNGQNQKARQPSERGPRPKPVSEMSSRPQTPAGPDGDLSDKTAENTQDRKKHNYRHRRRPGGKAEGTKQDNSPDAE